MQKLFDIVNTNDQVIGIKTAAECHADPQLIHRVVHFTLFDPKTKKFLIAQRSFEVKFDSGIWCFMGEHVLSGESYESTLKKGIADELGITSDFSFVETAHNVFTYATQAEFVRFFVVNWNGEKIQINKTEIIDYKWISLKELLAEKNTYSKMTQYWIENTNWRVSLM